MKFVDLGLEIEKEHFYVNMSLLNNLIVVTPYS